MDKYKLISYFRDWIKSTSLESQYNQIVKWKHILGQSIQHGGNLVDKSDKVLQVAKLYSQIKLDDIANNKAQIQQELQSLLDKINIIEGNIPEALKATNEDKIINNINILSANISQMVNGFNVIPNDIKIDLPFDIASLPDQNIFVELSKEYRQRISKISNNLSDASSLNKFSAELSSKERELDDLIRQMDNLLASLVASNNEFNLLTNYNFNQREIIKVEPFESIISRLRGLTRLPDIENFVTNKVSLYESGKYRQNRLIDDYNNLVIRLDPTFLARNALPSPYFNGGYVIRVSNNLLMAPSLTLQQLNLANNLINGDIKNIYQPDFAQIAQLGGVSLEKFDLGIRTLQDRINLYNSQIYAFNVNQMHTVMHAMFLSLIATNQILQNGYTIYVYMNRGILEFFRGILDNMSSKIDSLEDSSIINYLRKYHYVTIKKLQSFVTILSQNMTPKDIIDIRKCSGETADNFLVLNYFKTVMESYNEMYQNKISIYSRINDIGYAGRLKDYGKEFFLSDYQYKSLRPSIDKPDPRIMWINKQACRNLQNDYESIKFTQVFDTENFPSNGDISKYMTLDTQLAKGKSVGLITYGYSGTGKTYTLFGNKSKTNEDGILQFTIDNINGLQKLKFRVYEIYGYGLPYPHYWRNPDGTPRISDTFNKIYHYNLNLEPDNIKFNSVEVIDSKDILAYTSEAELLMNVDTKTKYYTDILSGQSERILKNFDSFVNEVEAFRQKEKRIRDTPNNPVSSRSILVYDFQLYINDPTKPPVPFLIIDLPGREEIIPTYVDAYIDNNVIKGILSDNNNNNILRYKFMLSVMCINPLAVPIFNHKIYDIVRNRYKDVLTTPLPFRFYYKTDIKPEKVNELQKTYILKAISGGGYEISGVNGKQQGFFSFEDEFINLRGSTVRDLISRINSFSGFGYIKGKDNTSQYYSLLSIHVMNRLILMNRFDIIQDLYANICEKEINSKINQYIRGLGAEAIHRMVQELISTRFKGDFIELVNTRAGSETFKQIVKNIGNGAQQQQQQQQGVKIIQEQITGSLQEIKDTLIKLLSYDYFLTPFEGININENIIGLVKYLASKTFTDPKVRDTFLQRNIERQDLKLDFVYQQKLVRMWLISEVKDKAEVGKFFDVNPNQVPLKLFKSNGAILEFDFDNMNKEYEKFKTSYKSDRIFNYENPLIESILLPYIKRINDYKVFYLFANYQNELSNNMKCANQYKLLQNTRDFVNTIIQ